MNSSSAQPRQDITAPASTGMSVYCAVRIAALALALLIAAPGLARAQSSVSPDVLYSGMNVLTVTAPKGIRQIMGWVAGRWQTLHTGLGAPYIKITSGPVFASCAKRATLTVFIMRTQPARLFRLRVVDCEGSIRYFGFEDSEEWNVYREQFGNVTLGTTACHTFRVDTRATTVVIDSVTSPSPLFQIRFTGNRPPLRVRVGGSYLYDVCFRATKLGFTKMPIMVYLRRKYPAGGYTNFIVADTAYVNVIPAPNNRPVPITIQQPPRPKPRVLVAQPKPVIINRPKPVLRPKPPTPKPVLRVDTLRPPPTIAFVESRSTSIVPALADTAMPPTAGVDMPLAPIETVSDPTPHRVVLMPTARSVDSGKVFVANYEGAGWLAGYGLNDRTTVLAGFAYVPDFIQYNLVFTAGGRYEFVRDGNLRVAAGVQANYSQTKLSTIVLAAPYVVASLGDDDQRVTAGCGYTWRRHTPSDSTAPFEKTAVAAGLGGDYRFAERWKVAAEAYFLQDATYQPIVATLRYFGRSFALDAGLGFDLALSNASDGTIRVAPIVSATFVW